MVHRRVRKVLIIANMQKTEADSLVGSLREHFESLDIPAQLICFKGKPEVPKIDDDVDLAVSLGGDGTVLFSARLVASREIPILAVNIGDFGFITEISKDEWQTATESFLSGGAELSARLMLEVVVIQNGEVHAGPFLALNDAVIGAHHISKVVKLGVRISNTVLGLYRADGLLVATPTGSTAYSMAAGGPILTPEMEAMVLNPICPFTLSNRPLVVPADETITVEVETQRSEIILTLDGQIVEPLQPGHSVVIRRARRKAMIVRSQQRNFQDVLRAKLKWAGGPDA